MSDDVSKKRGRGRPRNGFDKAEYNRQYMRRKRAKAKAAREAAKEITAND